MDSIKEYNKSLDEAKKRAAKLLKELPQIELMEVASDIKVSFSTIMLYKSGNGQNLETAIKIIEALKKP
jgi:hypothetical protein